MKSRGDRGSRTSCKANTRCCEMRCPCHAWDDLAGGRWGKNSELKSAVCRNVCRRCRQSRKAFLRPGAFRSQVGNPKEPDNTACFRAVAIKTRTLKTPVYG